MRRGTRLLAIGAVLLGLLSGCASVPTKGTLRSSNPEGLAQEVGGVGVEARPPRSGASAQAIVNGFLEAMADSRAYDVARQYLAPAVAAAWKPESKTQVFQQTGQLTLRGDVMHLRAPKIATLDDRGSWNPAKRGELVTFSAQVVKVNGQFRISKAPDGALLGSNQLEPKLAPQTLYFLTPDKQMLVPDPVYLPRNLSSGQSATQLVQQLLKGPTSRLGVGVISIAPPGTEIQVSVPVKETVATVALSEQAGVLLDQDRRHLAAQIVWTLKSVTPRVRITVGDAPLLPDLDVLEAKEFAGYDPAGRTQKELFGLKDGRIQRINGLHDGVEIRAVPLKTSQLYAAKEKDKAESFAVNLRADAGAVVVRTDKGPVVRYAQLDSTESPDQAESIPARGTVLRPSYDNQDNLWILDRANMDDPRLRVRDRDLGLREVAVDFRGDQPLVLRMAPDGVRALLVMKSKATGKTYVQTAVVIPGNQLTLGQFRPLELPLDDITDASWNPQGILIAGRSTGSSGGPKTRQPWQVDVDGSRPRLLAGGNTIFEATLLESNLNLDTLPVVRDPKGHLHWQSKDLNWITFDDPDDATPITPTYPG